MPRPKIPYAKGRKFCIFCGSPADSAEHIWPDWAKHILPPSYGHRRFILHGRRSTGVRVKKGYQRQGAVHSVRIKRVCGKCNSTWMSAYEERVRFHLERMIQGKRAFLDAEARQTLAEYLTYKLMVVDWIDESPVLPAEIPAAFYRSRQMPEFLTIWLFNCVEGGWRGALHTEAFGIDRIEVWHPDLPVNTKGFAIGFGDLFVYAAISTKLDLELEFEGGAGFRLWPPEDYLLTWPLRVPITSKDAHFVATALQRIGRNTPGVIDLGDLNPR